eukprot:jgi/Chlat1/5745/Chrsp38S05572
MEQRLPLLVVALLLIGVLTTLAALGFATATGEFGLKVMHWWIAHAAGAAVMVLEFGALLVPVGAALVGVICIGVPVAAVVAGAASALAVMVSLAAFMGKATMVITATAATGFQAATVVASILAAGGAVVWGACTIYFLGLFGSLANVIRNQKALRLVVKAVTPATAVPHGTHPKEMLTPHHAATNATRRAGAAHAQHPHDIDTPIDRSGYYSDDSARSARIQRWLDKPEGGRSPWSSGSDDTDMSDEDETADWS